MVDDVEAVVSLSLDVVGADADDEYIDLAVSDDDVDVDVDVDAGVEPLLKNTFVQKLTSLTSSV